MYILYLLLITTLMLRMQFISIVQIRIGMQYELKGIFLYFTVCIYFYAFLWEIIKKINTLAYVDLSVSILVTFGVSNNEQLYLIPHINQIFTFKNKITNCVNCFKYQNLKQFSGLGVLRFESQLFRKLRHNYFSSFSLVCIYVNNSGEGCSVLMRWLCKHENLVYFPETSPKVECDCIHQKTHSWEDEQNIRGSLPRACTSK